MELPALTAAALPLDGFSGPNAAGISVCGNADTNSPVKVPKSFPWAQLHAPLDLHLQPAILFRNCFAKCFVWVG